MGFWIKILSSEASCNKLCNAKECHWKWTRKEILMNLSLIQCIFKKEWTCFHRRKQLSGPVKLSRTEQVVTKQFFSPEQQNRVERLFIKVGTRCFGHRIQIKNASDLFCTWESPHPHWLFKDPLIKKQIQLYSPAKKNPLPNACLQTTDELSRHSLGDMGTGSPHMPSWSSDLIWTCRRPAWEWFEGMVEFLALLQGMCMLCPGGTHSPWLASIGSRMGYRALNKNKGHTEGSSTHSMFSV